MAAGAAQAAPQSLRLRRLPKVKPKNILFVLTDDHRYDAMGFMKPQSFGETPTLDRLAREHGVNANQVFSWRKLYEAGLLVANTSAQVSELVPVTVASSAQVPETDTATGVITLEIGRVRLRIEGQANATTLAQVLDRVLR